MQRLGGFRGRVGLLGQAAQLSNAHGVQLEGVLVHRQPCLQLGRGLLLRAAHIGLGVGQTLFGGRTGLGQLLQLGLECRVDRVDLGGGLGRQLVAGSSDLGVNFRLGLAQQRTLLFDFLGLIGQLLAPGAQ